MADAHASPLRQGHRGDALRGLDWLVISGPISEEFALRIAGLCFLGPPVDHGDGSACYRRRPEVACRTRRRTLVIQRHGGDGDAPVGLERMARRVGQAGCKEVEGGAPGR